MPPRTSQRELVALLGALIALPLTVALSTVSSISLLGLLAMEYGGSFGGFGLGIRSLETVITLAQDDSSSDWSTVCDTCYPAWCYDALLGEVANWTPTFSDFGCGECDITIATTFVAGCLPCDNTAFLIESGWALPVGAEWTSMEIDIAWKVTRVSTTNFRVWVDDVSIHMEDLVGEGAKTVVLGPNSGDVDVFYRLQIGATTEGSGAYANITGLRFYGTTGTPNLFGVDDC